MDSTTKGLIFDIQRYAIHDGPGIRTIAFLKGCPIRCQWCANPESQKPIPEITFHEKECINCDTCIEVCSRDAVTIVDGARLIDKNSCDLCGQCVERCPSEAIEMMGRYITAKNLFDEMATDAPFWERSSGGITLSGGEPLLQPDFVLSFLNQCKKNYVHTVIETALHAPKKIITEVLCRADEIICDIKIMDEQRHKSFIGVSNKKILDNLSFLLKSGKPVLVRMPLIPTVNNDTDNLRAVGAFLKSHGQAVKMELLPYHRMAESKYERLEKSYQMKNIMPPTQEEMNQAIEELKNFNITMVRT